MVTTLFLTLCDVEMGKIVTEQMSRQALNMTELRAGVLCSPVHNTEFLYKH